VRKVYIDFNTKALLDKAENLIKAGADIDKACASAVDEVADLVYGELKQWAELHKDKGDMLDSLVKFVYKNPVVGKYFAKVGFDIDKNKDGFFNAIFLEYGTPTQLPQGFITALRKRVNMDAKKINKRTLDELEKKAGGSYAD